MGLVTIPILPSPDLDVTSGFYEALGFVERARWPEEYLILGHPDGLELHFWFHADLDPSTNDAGCFVRFDTVEACRGLHDTWSAARLPPAESREIPRLHAPSERSDGSIEWALIDPHGNLIRLGAFPR